MSIVDTASQQSHSPSPPVPYENVGRQAWILLWIAFATFTILLVGVPLSINWYIHNATRPLPTQVEAIRGTTLIMTENSEEPTAVINTIEASEGEIIRTDDIARANMSVYESEQTQDTLTTVQLRSNSELVVDQVRTPRFNQSQGYNTVGLSLNLGRARVTGNPSEERDLDISVTTPHSTIRFQDGSAAIAVNNDTTEVSARRGEVSVEAEGRTVIFSDGRRTTVMLGSPPTYPQATSQNLVANGDFSQPLEETWIKEQIVDAGDLSDVIYGDASVIDIGGRLAAYFVRNDAIGGIHTETSLTQKIDTDVQDFDSLVLRLDARLISQSLSGGGILSSEFPLMVRIDFIDIDGNPQFWTWGFYAVDPVDNWPIRDGEKIPSFVWYEYESPDFLQSPTFPRPQKVVSIRVYASGHNYRSQVSDIGLIAE